MSRFLFIVCVVLIVPLACLGSEVSWSGKCVGVSDGDSLQVLKDGGPVRVRMFAIDCPERGQDFGSRARSFTSDLVFGKVVTVNQVDQDRHGRIVANVYVDGKSVNQELVRNGLAWWYRRHAPNDRVLEELERSAREQGLGLWSHSNPVPPWQWRQREPRTR